MAATINTAPEQAPLSYSEELEQLREKLDGRPYCQGVRDLLPHLTPWQVRNVVNGRKEDALVLRALRIYLEKQDADRQNAEKLLDQAQAQLRGEAS